MMNKIFKKKIGGMLEIYMVVKSKEEVDHTTHLKEVFEEI